MGAREELQPDQRCLGAHESRDDAVQTLATVVSVAVAVDTVEGGGIHLELPVQREDAVEAALRLEVDPEEFLLQLSCGIEHQSG